MNSSVSSPTRVRYGVLALACVLSMITYMDRVAIASAAGAIVNELGLQSVADMKWAFTAFALSYALFEVPTGWMGDMQGPRKALLRIVIWWSLFTVLTAATGLTVGGWMLGLGFLITVRFLFGMGEAGAYPNITRALHNWLPVQERGRGQGLVWFCGKLMGGLTPFLWTLLVVGTAWLPALFSWRGAFVLFGFVGLVWCVWFSRSFRNRPEEDPRVNDAELALIQAGRTESKESLTGVPWRQIVTNGNFQALCLMYGAQAYGWYFNITYLPQFLEQQYHVKSDSLLGAFYKGGPLWMGALGCLLGGFFTDAIIRRTGNRKLARRICGWFGHSMCVIFFLLCPFAPNAFMFFLLVSSAAFCTDLTVASAWSTCQDIGGRFAGIVGAFMNMIAGLSGAVAGWMTGSVLEHAIRKHADVVGVAAEVMNAEETRVALIEGYHLNFYSFAALYAVAFFCWFKIDPTIEIGAKKSEDTGGLASA